MSRTITFVTGNAKKLEEFVAILGTNFPFKVVSNPCRLTELKDIFKRRLLFLIEGLFKMLFHSGFAGVPRNAC